MVLNTYWLVQDLRGPHYILLVWLTLLGLLETQGQGFSNKDKFDWDLRAFDDKSCGETNSIFQEAKLYLRKKGDDLYLFAPDPKPLLRLLTGNKDGISIEKVFFSDYLKDSTGLGRNKGHSIFNGKVLKPVLRQELLESVADHFKMVESDRKALSGGVKTLPYWMSYLGKDTLNGTGEYEYNILLIKNSSLCGVKYHRNKAGRLHDFYNGIKILPDWPDKPLKIIPIMKTFSYQVPFDRNTATIENADRALYTDVLDDFIVKGVQIWAYASVEGDRELNEKLQKERAENIKSILEDKLPQEVRYRVVAQENWKRFDSQLKGSEFDSLRSYSRDQIKDLLKKEDNLLTFDFMLHDQRKAVVKVFYNTKPQDYDTVHILTHNFRQALDSIASRKKAGRPYSYYVRDAEGLYNWLYIELLKGKISEEDFMSWNFPLDPTYHKMINNRFWYQFHHPEFATEMMENSLKVVGLDREASDIERFNLISFILAKEQEGINQSGLTLEDLGRLVRSRSFRTIPSEDVLNMVIPLFGKLAVYYHQDFNTWDRRNLILNDLVTLFDQDSSKTEADWLKLAELSAALSNEFVAGEITDRFQDSDNSAFEILNLKINYDHWRTLPEETQIQTYYDQLQNAYPRLGEEAWCGLFGQSGGISFQALDQKELYLFFRENCTDNKSP